MRGILRKRNMAFTEEGNTERYGIMRKVYKGVGT
jgi:hypothetical protein